MELRGCPFCGSEDIVNDDGVGSFGESIVRYAAKCATCGVSFWHPEVGPANQPKETWFDWNTRPIEDALLSEIDLQAEIIRKSIDAHDKLVMEKRALELENEKLRWLKEDFDNSLKFALDPCGDEKHCGCVPFLLTEIARLESLVERERWIPVEERLPEPGSEVLVYRPEQDCGLPEYSGAAEYWGEYGGWYAMDRSRLHGITLWKPINKPEA